MGRVKKSLKKFKASKLEHEIKERKKYQIRRERREGGKKRSRKEEGMVKGHARDDDDDNDEREEEQQQQQQQQGEEEEEERELGGGEQNDDFEAYLEREMKGFQVDDDEDDDEDEDEDEDDQGDGDGDDGGEGVDHDNDDNQDDTPAHSEAQQHALELKDLQTTDPEFYEYLLKNDPTLLQWDGDAAMELPDVDEEPDDDRLQHARALIQAAQQSGGGLRALRAVWRQCGAVARRVAGELEMTDQMEDGQGQYVDVLLGWGLGPGLQLLLDRAGVTQDKRAVASWANPTLRTALQQCVSAVAALLSGPHDGPWTHRVLLALARRPRFWLLLAERPGDLKRVFSPLLGLWLSEEHRGARAGAFAVLSRALPMLPHPHGQRLVHMAGLTLTRSVRALSAHTVAHFAWLSASLAELQSTLPVPALHTLLFRTIRQHALHLRGALADPKMTLYSWPLLFSVRSTAHTLALVLRKSVSPSDHELFSLLYPIVHVVQGLLHYSSSAQWLPVHMHLLDVLLLLAPFAYIPVAAQAVRLLGNVLTAAGASDSHKGPPQALPPQALRMPQTAVTGRGPQRDSLIERLLGMVLRDAAVRPRHSAFPEWAVPLTRQLRYLCRYAQAHPARRIKDVCKVLEDTSRHLLELRGRLQLTPKQGSAVAASLMRSKKATPLENHIASHGLPEDLLLSLQREHKEQDIAQDLGMFPEQNDDGDDEGDGDGDGNDGDDEDEDDDDNDDDDDDEEEMEFEEVAPKGAPAAQKRAAKKQKSIPSTGGEDSVMPFEMWSSE